LTLVVSGSNFGGVERRGEERMEGHRAPLIVGSALAEEEIRQRQGLIRKDKDNYLRRGWTNGGGLNVLKAYHSGWAKIVT
jgi:hypothetical protein